MWWSIWTALQTDDKTYKWGIMVQAITLNDDEYHYFMVLFLWYCSEFKGLHNANYFILKKICLNGQDN